MAKNPKTISPSSVSVPIRSNSEQQGYSLLLGTVKVLFPTTTEQVHSWTVPLLGWQLKLRMPGFLFATVFYAAVGYLGYKLFHKCLSLFKHCQTYFKAIKNGDRFL